MAERFSISRRSFLATAAAGGFCLGLRLPAPGTALAEEGAPPEVNAWVVIHPDDTVVIRVARVEMGQGTLTGLAQLVAEELDADWEKVTTEYPTPGESVARDRVWGPFGTYGSQGIRASQQYMREGGAAARAMLLRAAADRWGVEPDALTVSRGVISGPDDQTLRYGELAVEAAAVEIPTEVALKDPSQWTIAGQPLKRIDTAPKLDGSQIYSLDHTMPGMLNAAIRQVPVPGGKVASFDADAIREMPGVREVVAVGEDAVAVIADTWWRAKTALDALPVEWDMGENADLSMDQIHAMLDEGLEADEAFIGNSQGDFASARADAAQMVEAVYHFPYQHHATMEPMNATALWTPERCEVWTATQDAEAALAATSTAADLPIEQCEVYRFTLGGGFGRRTSSHDYVHQAVAIAKAMPGTPVKLIWSREEDMLHGCYHPITKARMVGTLDSDGELTGLHMRISGQSIFAGLMPEALEEGLDPLAFQGLNAESDEGEFGYSVPNLLVDHAMRNPPVRPGFWRGVNNNQNAFYLESFMDELAHAAGRDPLEFRRSMMAEHPRHRAVLDAVAEAIGWDSPPPEGVFRGICQHMGYGSYVAAAAEVSVDDQGQLTVHRIVAATDPGQAVNPQQIEAQIEGSFAYGLSAALLSEITVSEGRIEQANFDTYPVVTMREMPAVESIVMPSGGFWGGVGEPTIFVAGPAVMNAIFAATGKRVRTLPLSTTDLRTG